MKAPQVILPGGKLARVRQIHWSAEGEIEDIQYELEARGSRRKAPELAWVGPGTVRKVQLVWPDVTQQIELLNLCQAVIATMPLNAERSKLIADIERVLPDY